MQLITGSAIWMAFALVLLVSGFAPAQNKTPAAKIVDAEKLPLGTDVTIEGTVTVGSGSFRSSFDDYGFQVEDKTGGMYVTIKSDLHLTVGQRVRLNGKRSQTALKFQIIETDENNVQILSGRMRRRPLEIKTGQIDDATIGRLVEIGATVTKPVDAIAPYGFRVPIDDGSGEIIVYVSLSTGISPKQFAVGKKVQLIGIAGQFKGHYLIYPRSQTDVKIRLGPRK